MMASVLDHNGNEIRLRDCDCGSEPTYWSATGMAHEIICRACGAQTDMEICGVDAVHEWNEGKVFATAEECPVRSQHLTPTGETP